jgi:hypothetical protein
MKYVRCSSVIITAVLLCACVGEPVPADEPIAASELASVAAAPDRDAGDALAVPRCPSGSTRHCDFFEECVCCWESWDMCCPIETPYVWCNLSGDCRCGPVP